MNIIEKVKNLPSKPGCYIYYNKDKKVIYIGKAKNLNKRVSSYFNRVHNIKTTRLVREIADLDFFIVNNERESLLLEENLIKKYRPRFNILLNDDKAYPYIVVTNEKDPEYKYVRKFDKKALRSFGPLPIGSSAREIMTVLQRTFPLRRCKGNLGSPCLYFHINQCSGACFKVVDPLFYKKQIKHIDKFFKGDTKEVIAVLESKMQKAADNLQFEEAQRIRDSLKGLQLALAKNDVDLDDNLDRDIIAYMTLENTISIVTLFYRAGKLLFKDETISEYHGQDLSDVISLYINQIYQKNMIPKQIIIPEIVDFEFLKPEVLKVATKPIKKNEINLWKLAQINAQEAIVQNSLKTQTVNNNYEKILHELQNLLKIETYPYHIEMFDISNIANEFVTGSCVVYKGGKPSIKEFRKYNIEIEDQGDSARLENMIYRRFQKALIEKRDAPDLIIMDGGIIQIHSAKKILESLSLDNIPVIGLVKDDKHKTSHLIGPKEEKINLIKNTPLFNFLSAIQIRVDNYAKSGFRKKQNQAFLHNDLEKIKGLGKKKIQELFKKYDSINQMKNSDFNNLNKIIKNKHTTNLLLEYLNSKV
ncbi:excinuclease ABC subunit C [Williamsoniiplasma somnilux]|uniref:UvrABC system protein C n=1 Tax=Williamsoniiplasma somnilux TaxID=215578 RepID=A0A2K8P1J7_9MOLU|nr:excinuclease ABC subunit UvrC [Williamsoniiplasma somnilux]ATZ18881.1 excinuclease ABC subunit C [Williamsoniiplasma somnilux]